MRAALVAAAAAALTSAAPALAAAPAAPPPLVAVRGLDSSQLPNANPADVQVAVGPTAVVEAVNAALAVWSPTGQPLKTEPLDALVARRGDSMTDPRVLYDTPSGRFLLVVFDITRSELDVAASQTTDPSGSWTVVALASEGCPDQPRLGSSTALVVVTDDLFTSCRGRGRFIGGEVTVLSKADLLAGVTSPRRSQFGPDARFGAITPVTSLSPTTRQYLVAIGGDGKSVQLLRVDTTEAQSIPFTSLALSRPVAVPPPAPQAGSATPVDTGDNRVQNAVFEAGRVWLTAAEACPAAASRSCARLVELATAQPRVVLDGTISSTRWLYYPALVPDALGNVAVAFDESSPAEFPSLGYTYVRPDGRIAPTARLATGTAPNESGRFGDYSGAARDPSDPTRLWFAAEIGGAVGGTTLGWATAVDAVRVPPQAPAVAGTTTTRSDRAVVVRADVYAEGAPTTVRVQYGVTRGYGGATAVRRLAARPGAQAIAIRLPTLRRGRTYHVRVVATSTRGRTLGGDRAVRVP